MEEEYEGAKEPHLGMVSWWGFVFLKQLRPAEKLCEKDKFSCEHRSLQEFPIFTLFFTALVSYNWTRPKCCVKNTNCNSTNFKGTVADWIFLSL